MSLKLKQELATGSLGTQICEIEIDTSAEPNSSLSTEVIEEIQNGFFVGKCVPQSCKFSLKLLENEENFLKQLSHSNIIKMAGSFETDSQKILVLESFCQDLDYYIYSNSQPLPSYDLFDLKQMVSDIANALEHLHSRSISHNDIKPSNILMDAENNFVLSDFGTAFQSQRGEAKSSESLHDILSFMNKTYFSPEAIDLVEQKVSHFNPCVSDIFSFGLTIFQMMFGGQLPYEGNNYTSYDKKFSLLHSDPDKFFEREEFAEFISYWKEQFGFRYSLFIQFLQGVLNPNPVDRMTASDILDHQWLESC